MTQVKSSIKNTQTIKLKPNYTIPGVIILASLPLIVLNVWLGITVLVFGLFLTLQTMTIRLQFTPHSLEVYRREKKIRDFPYQTWLYWRVFYPKFPVLFYFREVKSIHFLPIIFEADMLLSCLETYCPLPAKSNQPK